MIMFSICSLNILLKLISFVSFSLMCHLSAAPHAKFPPPFPPVLEIEADALFVCLFVLVWFFGHAERLAGS